MHTFRQDARLGLRALARRPAFAAVAIAALALGIGANTAIFSVVHAVLLRGLPYGSPDRLAMVWLDNWRLQLHEDLMSYPIFEDWKKNSVFEEMAPFTYSSVTLTGGVLAAIGVYGVMHHLVAQRTREIGIRMARGARRGDMMRMVLGQAAALAVGGLAVGLAGAAALSRWVESMLYGVARWDAAAYGCAAAVLARRAAKVDPMIALRHE